MKMFWLCEPNSQDADWPNGMNAFQFNGNPKQIMEKDISNEFDDMLLAVFICSDELIL